MGEIFLGLGANGERQVLRLGQANRHGLIAGATGTGKTVTLQGLAESFSAAGAPITGDVLFFCNAGLESSMGWFVAHELLGNTQATLYDGSLAEWTKDTDLPMTRHVPLD